MTVSSLARARLLVSVEEALDRATRFGKSMVTFSHGGATHERIGVIERIERGAHDIQIFGAHHASRIARGAFVSIEVDRTSKMKEKVYPRLSFCDAAGNAVFAIVGFEGLEPFDAALAGCDEEALPVAEPAQRSAPTGESATAPAPLPFDALQVAQQSGAEVVIRHGAKGFAQEWQGKIAALKPAMGFINIIDPDFHLHLKDGALSTWQPTPTSADGEVTFAAVGTDGNPTGLTISGPASAFSATERA